MDRTVPVDALLEHAAFLRALAGHLVREPADADDAVQATWETSLRAPPRSGGSVRAWLGTVLRNVVRQDARRRGRAHTREAAAAQPERMASTHTLAARRETIRHVADAVLALPEPFRETVLLRYYEALPPRTIALRMDVPVATVKSRLVRARERLRASLAAHETDWRTALVPLAGPGLAAGASLGSTLGGIAMASNVKLVMATMLVLLLVGAGGWLAWDGVGGTPDDDAAQHGAMLDAPGDAADAGPSLRAAGRTATAEASLPSPLSPEELARRAEEAAGDTPAVPVPTRGPPKGRVSVGVRGGIPWGTRGSVTLSRAGKTYRAELSPAGGCSFQDLPAGTYAVRVEVDGKESRTTTVRASDTVGVSIAFEYGTARVWGIAYDELGRPREGARVRISTHLVQTGEGWKVSAGGTVFSAEATTGPDGRYAFGELPEGTYTIVGELTNDAAHRSRNIRSFSVTLGAEEDRRLDLGERYEDPTWSGRVRLADGSPVTEAGNIFLETVDGERRMYVGYDAEGRFSEQVPVGTWRMEFVLPLRGGIRHRMHLVQTNQRLEMSEHGSTDDAVMPGTRLTGTFTARAKPMRQTIHLERTGDDPDAPESLISSATRGAYAIPVQGDGTFALVGLRPGTYRVRGHPAALDKTVELRIEPQQATVELELRAAR